MNQQLQSILGAWRLPNTTKGFVASPYSLFDGIGGHKGTPVILLSVGYFNVHSITDQEYLVSSKNYYCTPAEAYRRIIAKANGGYQQIHPLTLHHNSINSETSYTIQNEISCGLTIGELKLCEMPISEIVALLKTEKENKKTGKRAFSLMNWLASPAEISEESKKVDQERDALVQLMLENPQATQKNLNFEHGK